MHKDLLIVIPAYNEEKAIDFVLSDLLKCFDANNIIVVNDGSTDKTSDAVKKHDKVILIELPFNLGVGASLQSAFKYINDKKQNTIAIQFDGDGQHIAEEIEKIIKPIIDNNADVVIGSRYLNKNNIGKTTLPRKIGIKILSFLISVLLKQNITDCTSGFRAYNAEAVKFLAKNFPQDYPEPESIILLARSNFKVKEVDVLMRERHSGTSSITFLKSVYYMFKQILAIIINYFRV